MISVEELLQVADEHGASDVHITVGVPPKMRVNGELLNMDYPRLMPDDAEGIIFGIMDKRHKAIFEHISEYRSDI